MTHQSGFANASVARIAAATVGVLALIVALLPSPVAVAQASAAGPSDPQEVAQFFDDLLARQMTQEHVVGATVAVVKDAELLFAKGYGHVDQQQRLPVYADRTLFHIGSDGKLFTWTAVMQLVEQGQLDLYADVNSYLDFQIPATYPQPITLHHLMTHTAGFEEQLNALAVSNAQEVLPLHTFLVRSMPARVYPPGALFAYSNYGTALAGYIVERVSGTPYAQYITSHILHPLEMSHSAATQPLPPALMADLSPGYRYGNGDYHTVDFEWFAAPPAAPVRSTATDMAHFMIAHLNQGRYSETAILEPATVAEMHRQHFAHDPRLYGMTYGFVESRENNQRIIWHMGETAHFATLLALLPEHNVGLFVSYNTQPVDAHTTLSAFLDHYYPTPAAPALQPADAALAPAAQLAGTYISTRVAHTSPQKLIGWMQAVPVRVGEDGTIQIESQRYVEIEPGLFKQVDGERTLTFRTDASGRVTHLFWGPFALLKVPWYQTLSFQLTLLAACLVIMLTAMIAWALAALLRRRRGDPPPERGARAARWLASALGLATTGLLAWLVVLLLGFSETYIFPGQAVTLITWLLWLVVLMAVGVLALAVLAWKRRYWNAIWRAHYTLVALAALGVVWVLYFYNLIAPVS